MNLGPLLLLCLVGCVEGGIANAETGERTPDFAAVLTRAGQVLELTEREAARAVPLRLTGVVVGEAPPIGKGFVLWDGGDFIYVRNEAAGAAGTLARGDQVEIEGVSNAGGFTPSVVMTAGRTVGRGELPGPQAVDAGDLLAGRHDAEWVRLRGIVRSCEPSTEWAGSWRLTLASGGHIFAVHANDELTPEALVDAEVRVDALVFNQHNLSRQSVGALLFVPAGTGIAIETPPPADPFAAPVRAVATLLQFERGGRGGHRVHVRGRVTHHEPGRELWIRDGARGLRVFARQNEMLPAGTVVGVLGFPVQGAYSPRLEDAVFRRIDAGANPEPFAPRDLRDAIAHESDLLALEGRLVDLQRGGDRLQLLLDWRGALVPASVAWSPAQPVPTGWRSGAMVRAAGICRVPSDEPGRASGTWEPRSFELQLRRGDDLRVLRSAPWWSRERVFGGLGAASGVGVLVIGMQIAAARRRRKEAARERARAESEFAAILAERNRVAREIHDTLAQGLAAVSMRLELATNAPDPAAIGAHLATAHRLVRETLAEARTSIWAMRSHSLELRGLAGALEGLLRQFAEGTGIETRWETSGTPAPLAPVVENELLRIGHEAIANAFRHGAPRRVEVGLHFRSRQVELAINDDGCGFDPAHAGTGAGQFGVIGMRERAEHIGAVLELESAPGRGTRVTVVVPLAGGQNDSGNKIQAS